MALLLCMLFLQAVWPSIQCECSAMIAIYPITPSSPMAEVRWIRWIQRTRERTGITKARPLTTWPLTFGFCNLAAV